MTDSSTGRRWSEPPKPKGAGAQAGELKDLVIAYAKQETVDPLKTLGRHLGYGLAGSIFLGLGLSMLLLALLRGLQRIEFFNDPLEIEGGTWSWLPYLITAAVGLVIVALFIARLMRIMQKRNAR